MRKIKRRHRWARGNTWWTAPPPSHKELLQRLAPLLTQIRRVDGIVAKISKGEGRVADLVDLEQVLEEPFSVAGTKQKSVQLSQPSDLRIALSTLSQELHLEVHAMDGKYPCYLLCRVTTDWDAPDTVLEDLHISSVANDFFPDERFTVLLRHGRSRVFLRLSPYREKLRKHLADTSLKEPSDWECDDVLQSVATLVLAAAWYEDQRLPFYVADVFGLHQFRAALEQVGFVLGSQLYQVTTALQDEGETTINFFDHVYENQHLARLIERLACHGVEDPSRLETASREAFVALNQAFSVFLSTTDTLKDLERLELYKIVLGNFGRLHEIADRTHWTPVLDQAVQAIEACATSCINSLHFPLSSKRKRPR